MQYTFKFDGVLVSPKCEDNTFVPLGKADELQAPAVWSVCLFKLSIVHTILTALI